MARESHEAKRVRVRKIIALLKRTHPDAKLALDFSDPLELLVALILAAQARDDLVNVVTPNLFRKYRTAAAYAGEKESVLQKQVSRINFYRQKTRSIQQACAMLVKDFGGQVPEEMDKLLTLPGVARKTANVVLGTWFCKNEGLVVDTHVTRVSRRLELTRSTDAPKIEQDLMKIIPRERWTLFSHQIIWHGRKLCTARSPKCVDCPLENLCHAADKTWSTVEIHKNATW